MLRAFLPWQGVYAQYQTWKLQIRAELRELLATGTIVDSRKVTKSFAWPFAMVESFRDSAVFIHLNMVSVN